MKHTERARTNDAQAFHRKKTVAAWNAFDEKHGHFADEWNQDFLPGGKEPCDQSGQPKSTDHAKPKAP
jgi:hypothetical protein